MVAGVVGLVLLVGGATTALGLALVLGVSSTGTTDGADAAGSAVPTGSPAAAPPGTGVSAPPSTAVAPQPVSPSAAAPAPAAPKASPAPATPRRAPALLLPVVGVTDGDTIKVRVGGVTERVRLIGLDAPELKGDECWAQKASSRMQSLVQSRSVQLVRDPSQADRDRYGRLLRHVVADDGRLAAQVLIEGGFAKEYTYAAAYEHREAYLAAQKRAKAKRVGVWSAACAAPVVAAPAPAAPAAPGTSAAAPAGRCVIKGNISAKGEKIYHVPGGGSYDVTVITASKGERWFCTEQEARNAGWRKARN